MINPPRIYRRIVTVPLYRLKKATPSWVWVLMFLLCCFILPFGAAIKLVHPGTFATIRIGYEIGMQNPLTGVIFIVVLLVLGSSFMFILNGAFVFLRAAAGYEVHRNGTIFQWLRNKATKQQSNKATKQQSNKATKQQSNKATKARGNELRT